MTNLRKRFSVLVGLFAATGVGAGLLIACSDDSSVTPDGGVAEAGAETSTPETGGGDTGIDAGDAGDAARDQFVPIEAGTLAEFIDANPTATCARFKDCCGKPAFDTAACENDFAADGWVQSIKDLTVAGVATGGKVTYDPVAGSDCLTKIRNMTCTNTTAAEFKASLQSCFAAARGTVAAGGACKANVECANTTFCDLANNGGTCTTIKAAGTTCSAALGECSYRNSGTSQCLDPGDGTPVCAPSLANGANCDRDFECTSNSCYVRDEDGGVATTCDDKVDFVYGICEVYAP